MAKMEKLSGVEEEVFTFLRRSFHVGAHALKPEFQKLLAKLRKYEGNPLRQGHLPTSILSPGSKGKINNVNVQD